MKQTTFRNAALSLMAVVTLMMVAGSLTPSFAQWPWDRDNGRNNRNNDRNNDRYEDRSRRSRDQQDRDVYGNPRNGNNRGNSGNDRYGNGRGGYDDGYYGGNNRNGGFQNDEQEKGYRDGLRRGQEDRQTNRIPDPNNSSHYRKGNADYRLGFRRGYDDSYPTRYGNNNRRR
jgi:hypothetical protein